MTFFGTISLLQLGEILIPISPRALQSRLISAAPQLLLNVALSYRGFRSLRFAAQ